MSAADEREVLIALSLPVERKSDMGDGMPGMRLRTAEEAADIALAAGFHLNTPATDDGEKFKKSVGFAVDTLRSGNYRQRWSAGSPAIQMLNILEGWLGEKLSIPGCQQDPEVPTEDISPWTEQPTPATVQSAEGAVNDWDEVDALVAIIRAPRMYHSGPNGREEGIAGAILAAGYRPPVTPTDPDEISQATVERAFHVFIDSFNGDEAGDVQPVFAGGSYGGRDFGWALTGGNDARSVFEKARAALDAANGGAK